MAEEKMTFKYVVAYDDFGSALRALEVSDFLTSQLEGELVVDYGVWRFDALRVPALQMRPSKEAIAANLIIISMRGQAELPADVKTWIEEWLPERHGTPGILLALVDHNDITRKHARPLRAYLQHKADQGGLEFFYATRSGRGGWAACLAHPGRWQPSHSDGYPLIHPIYRKESRVFWS